MRVFIAVLVVLTFSSLWAEEKELSTDFKNFNALSADILKSGTLVVYDGLPREDLLPPPPPNTPKPEKEKSLEIHGYSFRITPHALKDKDMAALRNLCGKADTFRAWRGAKPCGGFHPNYCLQWKDGEKTVSVLLCFGCEEAKFYAAQSGLYCEVEYAKLKEMGRILENAAPVGK